MYYCPKCKKQFRQYQRRCPDCGIPCRHSDNPLIFLIIILAILFLGLVILALFITGPQKPDSGEPSLSASSVFSLPSESSTAQSSSPESSSVPATSVPATSTPIPSTSAPAPSTGTSTGSSGIGLYTNAELAAMDTTYSESGFGAGRAPNHGRPSVPVAEQGKYEKYDAHFIGEDTNVTYLTFDCGYEYYATDANGQKYRVTERILDVLRDKGVKAVFFVTMDYVESEPDLVRRMIDEGHAVGNHTNNHPVMPAQNIGKMEYEVMSLHNYVLEHFGYTMTLFRPPTGAYSIQSLAVVQNLGYKTVLWSFQHYDFDPENQPFSSAYSTITNNSHNGCIYLLHAVSEANAAVLGDVIDYLRTNNYEIRLFS